jgi:hypothetical protein
MAASSLQLLQEFMKKLVGESRSVDIRTDDADLRSFLGMNRVERQEELSQAITSRAVIDQFKAQSRCVCVGVVCVFSFFFSSFHLLYLLFANK